MMVNALDRAIGLDSYATHREGIGGRIRLTLDDFTVEERLHNDTVRMIQREDDEAHRYPVFTLRKRGVDTPNALRRVEKELGCRVHILGLKDAKAATLQYLSPVRRIPHPPQMLEIGSKIILELSGYSSKPLTRRDLMGNHFDIIISEVSLEDHRIAETVDEAAQLLREMRIPNFYGYQRFGSARPVSHLVGRALIKRRFDEAVRLLLTYTSEPDDPNKELRARCEDPANYSQVIKEPVRGWYLERQILRALIRRPGDQIGALRAVPLDLRRLFVSAYQSYLFNRALSLALIDDLDFASVNVGDIYALIDLEFRTVKIDRANSKPNRQPHFTTAPLLPLVGYAYRSRGERLNRLVDRYLGEEDVSPRDFYVKEMPELSVEGGFRSASMLSAGFNWIIKKNAEGGVVKIDTVLHRGSYATILLREVMKPRAPSASGF